ncbi:MAG: biopolymer transporter ExbD [Gemmataceae bacterium]|nr:biopolymer transporter ExbD [Gemmataceae bacterium]MCI0740636.1 biopolymer transporter ExbD [Gemmataceae bacterium]
MADKKRLLDVWIVEGNTVYREVPFAVVTDWLQQGRLLPDDRVRLAGGKTWHVLDSVAAFAPYLPKTEPLQTADASEALDPVDLGFDFKRPGEEEDEDVDMIPLIDISLVLLIFFMMTASVNSGFFSTINTPGAKHQVSSIAAGSFWIGMDVKSRGGQVEKTPDGKTHPWYSFGKEQQELLEPTTDHGTVLAALGKALDHVEGDIKIRIRADQSLPIEHIRELTLELQTLEAQLNTRRPAGKGRLKFDITGEVSEPKSK